MAMWTATMGLGERLVRARRLAGMTQQDMADGLHVSRRTVAGWEAGDHEPRFGAVVAWADLCQAPLEYLVDAAREDNAACGLWAPCRDAVEAQRVEQQQVLPFVNAA